MSMLIRYEGFIVGATDRFYNFSVSGASDGPRQFTVGIRFESFVSARLGFQDGPSISVQRIKEELDQETQDCPAKPQLIISGHDIENYLVTQHPKKAASKKRLSSCVPAHEIGSF